MSKDDSVVSVCMSGKLAADVDKFAELHSMSRTSAINYLLTKGLFYERLNDIDSGKVTLAERDLFDD